MVIIYCIYQQTDQNVLGHLAKDKKLFFRLLIEHQIFSYDLEAFDIYIQEHLLYLGLNGMDSVENIVPLLQCSCCHGNKLVCGAVT
jgi:hypothetical protein